MASYGTNNNFGNNDGSSNKQTRIHISLYASKLKNVAGIGKGTSDPYAVVTLLAGGPHEKPVVLGKTEVIKNNLNPAWTNIFETTYTFGKETKINVGIFDEIKGKSKTMGSALFEIGDILGTRGSIKAKILKHGGTIFVKVTKAPDVQYGTLNAQFTGVKLKNVDGMFSKSDPFFVISSHSNNAGGRIWQPVHRSEVIKNNLNPAWKAFSIPIEKLCDGDKDSPISIEVFDWEKNGKHQAMGKIQTSINGLLFLVGGANKTLKLLHKNKNYGTISVDSASISGENMGTSLPTTAANMVAGAATTSSSNAPPKKFLKINGITKINPEYKKWKESQGSGSTPTPASAATVPAFGQALSSTSIPPPMAPPVLNRYGPDNKPKFVDYISGGTEINLVVAIDYTGSNGDPRKPGTLHYIHRDGQLNDYEKALTAVGSIVARYDSDQMFPVLGFGAKYNGIIQHCFQVGKAPELHGITGMMEGYRGVFKTGPTMSGPTVFADVIQHAARQAQGKQDANAAIGEQSYTILLVLTDGAVTDIEQTKTAIRNASSAPLSIVIVGIGNADFGTMQFLDDFQQQEGGRTRDIVQFVEFGRHKHDRQALTRETLDEIPDQLVNYFYERNMMPLPPTSGSKININPEAFNSEEDIDLAMSMNSIGEFQLSNPVQATWDAQSYGNAATFLPPAMTPPGQSAQNIYNPNTASAPSLYTPSAGAPNGASAPQSGGVYAPAPGNAYAPSPAGGAYGRSPGSAYAPSPAGGAYGRPSATAPAPYGASVPYNTSATQSTPAMVPTSTMNLLAPANSYPGMQLQVQNPRTGQFQIVTVPQGVAPGSSFAVQL